MCLSLPLWLFFLFFGQPVRTCMLQIVGLEYRERVRVEMTDLLPLLGFAYKNGTRFSNSNFGFLKPSISKNNISLKYSCGTDVDVSLISCHLSSKLSVKTTYCLNEK